ncbi:MAG: hypothetical protein ACFFC7_04105 [Candidatus Hermodarchaeota archaeon]
MGICFPADLRLIQEPFTDYLKLFNEKEKIQLIQQVKLTLKEQLTGAIALEIKEINEANDPKIIGFCLFSLREHPYSRIFALHILNDYWNSERVVKLLRATVNHLFKMEISYIYGELPVIGRNCNEELKKVGFEVLKKVVLELDLTKLQNLSLNLPYGYQIMEWAENYIEQVVELFTQQEIAISNANLFSLFHRDPAVIREKLKKRQKNLVSSSFLCLDEQDKVVGYLLSNPVSADEIIIEELLASSENSGKIIKALISQAIRQFKRERYKIAQTEVTLPYNQVFMDYYDHYGFIAAGSFSGFILRKIFHKTE